MSEDNSSRAKQLCQEFELTAILAKSNQQHVPELDSMGMLQALLIAATDIDLLDKATGYELRNRLKNNSHQLIADCLVSERLEFEYDPKLSTRNTVARILESARAAVKEGAVAQHLVGAKLKMRFPHRTISNEGINTADVQTDRDGDFLLGDMPVHVTVAPMPPVFAKCGRNIAAGLRPLLLVPDRFLAAARSNAELGSLDGLAVESIESFVALNCDELSEGSRDLHPKQLGELLTIYNARVDAVETDKALMIEMPPLLAKAISGAA